MNLQKLCFFFEPTDVAPSTKPFQTPYWKAIKYITPNLSELKEIARCLNLALDCSTSSEIRQAAELSIKLLNYGIDNIIVTLGAKGVLIIRKGLATDKFLMNEPTAGEHIRFYPTEAIQDLVNVSGAGDCFASGFAVALISGMSEKVCVSVGFAAAKLALQSQSAVPKEIFYRSHPSWKRSALYKDIQLME
ncbi:hypothetical protein JTB14_023559 [Gonioctena quinquepunctata]|nr:hypothetical protein JTB14_023559 [Gonioctena quinquepunctata]